MLGPACRSPVTASSSKGELGARYASAFEGMTISAHDGITEITGEIIDPSHLQGLLERIAGLGLTLHSVTPHSRQRTARRPHDPEATKSDHHD